MDKASLAILPLPGSIPIVSMPVHAVRPNVILMMADDKAYGQL